MEQKSGPVGWLILLIGTGIASIRPDLSPSWTSMEVCIILEPSAKGSGCALFVLAWKH